MAAGGFPGWHLLVVFTGGTILMRSAGCCINDVADRDFDKHVQRTAQRPVTSGRISPQEALVVGAILALSAFALVLTTNVQTIVWSFAALLITLVYPYAKRWVSMPQAVLGLAFGFGIPLAFTAVQAHNSQTLAAIWGAVPPLAWLLLLGTLFWVLAYDTEYAMVDRDDDLKIGIKTSAITLGRWDVRAVLFFYVVFLVSWNWLVAPVVAQVWFWYAGVFVAACQVAWHGRLIADRSREGCFRAFRLNHWVGFALFCGVALSTLG